MSAYRGISIQVPILSFGTTAFCEHLISRWSPSDQQRDFVWITSDLITFRIRSPRAMYAAPGAGSGNSCSGLKKSTQVNWIRKHNRGVYSSSEGTELAPTLGGKKIAISLIAAKWHTKRKLTIGCYFYSQSDSDLPASLSPFWCQAGYSLPISFRPRQPKKALPHGAATSSLFWY